MKKLFQALLISMFFLIPKSAEASIPYQIVLEGKLHFENPKTWSAPNGNLFKASEEYTFRTSLKLSREDKKSAFYEGKTTLTDESGEIIEKYSQIGIRKDVDSSWKQRGDLYISMATASDWTIWFRIHSHIDSKSILNEITKTTADSYYYNYSKDYDRVLDAAHSEIQITFIK